MIVLYRISHDCVISDISPLDPDPPVLVSLGAAPVTASQLPEGRVPAHLLHLKLEGTARYAGLLLAPAEGFGLRPRLFFALRAKKVSAEALRRS